MSEAQGQQTEGAPPRAAPGSRTPVDPALLWQLGWVLATIGAAGLILFAIGKASILALLALLIMALPALVGALWRPRGTGTVVQLTLWALAATMAATLEGGLGGPLAVWCVMPAIATIVVEAPWILGIAFSGGALLAVTAINALHLASRLPHHPLSFWLAFTAVVTTAGGAVGGLGVARRRAKTMRGEVEAELESFQALMGDLPELALAMDLDGRAHAVFGRPLEGLDVQALHLGLVEAVDGPDQPRVRAALNQAAETGHAEVSFAPAMPGASRIAAVLQRTSQGGLTGILREAPAAAPVRPVIPPAAPATLAAAPDPDLLRRLQEAETAREKAEADAAGRSRFLANMSHELRTPLNAIMGFSDIMRTQMFGELRPKYAEYAELIHESGRHLLDLINDVLDMSKIEADRYELALEQFDARDAVNAALRLVRLQADDAGIKLRGVLPAGPVMVEADRRALKQIVINLVSNALKFTPAGGQITVSLETSAWMLELSVADTGVGIAPEDLKRIGKPYEQAGGADERAQGTGLGLSLVRSFAELHGGGMTIESRLGEGTAVSVRMPVLTPAAPVEAKPEAKVVEAAPVEVIEPIAVEPAVPIETAPPAPAPAQPPMPKVAPGGVPEPDQI